MATLEARVGDAVTVFSSRPAIGEAVRVRSDADGPVLATPLALAGAFAGGAAIGGGLVAAFEAGRAVAGG
ncbi:hypothetical protein [Microbacterium sp. RURRCA19A]|uniref:hypothetical protein n=1 Tax=Microbacterium sp. RURRCA19A TaxID=1907391 RepID=UPI0009550C2D|nr:hypothetical protein [Microbacterium sp. RURRCA19A]MDI9892377.1 hypothetical protein [Microbacterium sp. IEGM 1404]SIR96076.1 hypothetical protein SAMN05880568_2055 [Microbacterium sp. RURRCA19A]